MFNICSECGSYSAERQVDSSGPFVVCEHCGHKQPFKRLPLLVVTGASATGKSTVLLRLAPTMQECVCLDADILWCDAFNQPDNDYKTFRNLWLRMAKNISQAGRPVVLFGSATPGQFESCPESIFFSSIKYLAFVTAEEALVDRLKQRPLWRQSGTPETIERMVNFNRWFQTNAATSEPPMQLLDTTDLSFDESVERTRQWILANLRE